MSKSQSTGREFVRRNEVVEIITQLTNNMNEMSKYLMNDMNTMFAKHLYPSIVATQALLELLITKGILTKEEIDIRANEIQKEAIEKAKQVKEDEEGNLVEVNEDEDKKKLSEPAVSECQCGEDCEEYVDLDEDETDNENGEESDEIDNVSVVDFNKRV